MLASLLPGLRQFRTPFTVGVVCALSVWVLFGDSLPSRSEARGMMGRIYALGDFAGRPVVGAAIAITLYLLGDILKLSTSRITKIVKSSPWTRVSALVAFLDFGIIHNETYEQLIDMAEDAFRARTNNGMLPREAYGLINDIQREFPEIRMRLTASHLDVYLEYDRLASEAEFRINVSLFSVILWIALSLSWSAWFLCGLVATVALFGNGVIALRDANSMLVQAVASEVVTSRHYEAEKRRDEEFEQSSAN